MIIHNDESPKEFLSKVEPLLLQREAENNLPLGVLERFVLGREEGPCYTLRITKGEKTEYMALRTPPHLWILPSVRGDATPYIKAAARHLYNQECEVPGVIGDEKSTAAFVEEWTQLTSVIPRVHVQQGVHRLDELNDIPQSSGKLQGADMSHHSMVVEWMIQYGKETDEPLVVERAAELTESLIRDQRLFLWLVDGIPVSMAGRARTTKNGATINAVFTPDSFKKRGYATQAVWHLTKNLLQQGYTFCSLYTDLANPTSNSIYKKIGYKKISDSIVYHFHKN